jgi:hypothetical protein
MLLCVCVARSLGCCVRHRMLQAEGWLVARGDCKGVRCLVQQRHGRHVGLSGGCHFCGACCEIT